ncbi:MAG: hypothetical protein PSN34_00815 [Urechidicola sp.]|nr:hypothetical protein [Urechidicola sp.]
MGLFIRDKFSFIPTASALDIGNGNSNLGDTDYLRSYVGANPPSAPKNSPFANFSTEFDKYNPNTHNKKHISFNTRNGDWLATELTATNIEYTDCSAFCSNARITGSTNLCTSATYSVTSQADTVTWFITAGSNLVTTSLNGDQIVLQANPNSNGDVTLNATYSNSKCGTATVSKTIKVGSPTFPSTQMTGDDTPLMGSYKTYSVPTAIGASKYSWYFDVGGVTGTSIAGWEIQTGQGSKTINVKVGNTGLAVVVCKVSNVCGSAYKYKYVTVGSTGGGGGDPDPCEPQMIVSPNPSQGGVISLVIEPPTDPCDGIQTKVKTKNTVEIYNVFGGQEFKSDFSTNKIQLKSLHLKTGVYVVHVTTSTGITKQQTIVVE